MDTKYDFNLKMDQLKKLLAEDDYKTAYKIVDGIDWNRVRNVNLLTMAASVYEKNDKLPEAKRILVSALDRAPVGKRILYKLSELSVRTGDLDEAEDYYYEFRRADPTDIGNYLLQYMILKARHAPYDKQIKMLEMYTEADPDEKWLYELAKAYDNAGEGDKCVATCDKIALLYGSGAYSSKALRLKMGYEPLTGEQQNILYPRSYGEEPGVKESGEAAAQDEDNLFTVYGLMDSPDIASVEALSAPPAEEFDGSEEDLETAIRNSDALAAVRYDDEDAVFDEYIRQIDLNARDEHRQAVAKRLKEQAAAAAGEPSGEEETGAITDGESGGPERVIGENADKAAETAPETPDGAPGASEGPGEDSSGQLAFSFSGEVGAVSGTEDTLSGTAEDSGPETHADKPAAADEAHPSGGFHMIVEAASSREAFEIALNELKAIHRENGITNSAVKTSAAKLNETGFSDAVAQKIRGKDLVIEDAGALDDDILRAIRRFIETDTSGAVVVLLDTPAGLDRIEDIEPRLFELCDYISDTDDAAEDEPAAEDKPHTRREGMEAYEDDYDEDDDEEDEADTSRAAAAHRNVARPAKGEELEIDDFAQFCTQYAASIDCSITGKSMLALYERIELMEEEGIPLTKETAVDLIEEAADRAEKPPISKRIAGAFHSKYDKNGLLILKEDDFI